MVMKSLFSYCLIWIFLRFDSIRSTPNSYHSVATVPSSIEINLISKRRDLGMLKASLTVVGKK